jgi:hypothetical protein
MNVTSNIFSLIAIDTSIAAFFTIVGYGLGRIGYANLKADVEVLKNLVYPKAVVTS